MSVLEPNFLRMMGFGTYGYGGPYLSSSSSSSLSALAPPFTVERPVHDPCMSQMADSFTPLVEVTEPPYATPPNASLHNWLPPHSPSSGSDLFANPPPAFGPVPSSNAYRYAGLPTADSFSTNLPPMNTVSTPLSNACTYDQGLDVVATSLVEAKPYYPSYLSPALRGDSPMVAPDQPSYDWLSTTQFAPSDGSSQKEYTQRPSSKYTAHWGGSWNGPAEWEQGKQGQFDGSFGPKETDASSLPYKNYLNQEPHSFNSLKKYEIASHNIPEWNGSMNAEHVGDKSYVGRNSKFSPIDFTKPMMGSFSVVPETHSKAPSSPFVMKSTYGGSCEKRQHDTTCNDITSISKPSPGFIIRPSAIGTKSSEPEMGLFKRLNSGRDAANADHVGYYPSQESHLPQSFVGKVTPFDSSRLAIHLGRIDPFSVESSSTKDKALSNNGSINNDSLDHFFKVKSGLPNCHVNLEGFDAAANINDSISSFLNSSENVDPNNPSVDSPCWKGVPGSCFSPFKASEEGVPEKMKKQDGCNGLNLNMPMIFSLNTGEDISTQKPVEYHEFGWLGNGLPPPLKKYSVGNSAFGEHRVDDTVKTTYYPESSHDIKTPNSGSGDKSSSLFEHSHIVQQDSGEGRLPTEKKNTTGSVGADVNLNINDTLECGSSHTSPVKSTVCGHSLVDAATKLTKADGEESIMNMDVQMLINTMNSLSELLLTNCSSSSRQLKNKDLDALKTVISNLNSCILKHDENLSSIPESPSVQQSTLKYIEELSKHDENVLSMPDSPPIQQSTLQYIEELCKPNKALSPDMPQLSKIFAPSIQDPLDLQGVQRLTNHGSFVKNDDEVIASVSAKSDIDLLKQDEMTQAIKKILSENFHTEDTHPQTLLYKNLWLEAEASLCSTNYKARFNRLKIEMEKCKADLSKDVFEHDMMTQLRSDVPANSSPVEKLTPEVRDCPLPKFNPQDLPSLNHEDDDVMARFHVLRSRIENSSSMNATNGDGSSSSLSLFPDKVDKVAPETDDRPSPRISLQDSPTSSITGLTNDYEASVMARFHIIRDRVENSKFISDAIVENPVSFKVSCEHEADEVAPETTDDGSIQDYPVSTTTSHANQYEHSVLARFNILKSRVDNSGDKPAVGEPQEHGDLGYAGKRNLGPIICNRSQDGSSDVKEQPVLQSHIADNNEGNYMAAREFRLFVEDDPGHMINRPVNQLPAVCPDRSSSSDWEHVMKEEVWGHSC